MGRSEFTGIEWHEYIQAAANLSACRQSRNLFYQALGDQRAQIAELIEAIDPKRIGCLGAGYLNDIPLELLCEPNRTTYLVDWIPGVSVEGVRGSIISQEGGDYRCLFCSHASPEQHCTAFRLDDHEPRTVCDAFCPVLEPTLHCEKYEPGPAPSFVTHDMTAGVAVAFAKRARVIVQKSRTPEEAFRRAAAACRTLRRVRDPIPIEDDSLDFITCSMVVSQFDAEPYKYFSMLLEHKFGREALLQHEEKLTEMMEELRSALFRIQMEAHVDELYRLVEKEHGVVYFSVELFRSIPRSPYYFLVHEIPRALDLIGRRFNFDIERIPPKNALRSTPIGDATSIVQCYVLKPKLAQTA